MDAIEQLKARVLELEEENAQLVSINEALMNRVERDMDRQGNSFSLFQAAIALEEKVNERTAALSQALGKLEQSNRDLLASNEAAQAASRAKSAFLAAMSHELRTPMNGVIGMTELILGSSLDEEQRSRAETIRQSALSLLRILNDILDFSKIEAGKMDLESAPFDLRAITEQTLLPLRPQMDAKQLSFSLEWPDSIPTAVIGDSTRYAQIVTNLVGNAIKFTAKGSIRLSATLESDGKDAFTCRFEVEDTGVGIPDEAMPRLFASFTQADSSTTRKFGGTGLGLAIVRRLCQLMGGDCGVTSRVGRGSCFWFTLAFQHDTTERAPGPPFVGRDELPLSIASVRERSRGPAHVLIVEDNPVNRLVARGHLEAMGCTCDVAENGRQAVEMLSVGHRYDLVLMDCQMPEMDGMEATRQIRAAEAAKGARTPIVALTANAMVGDRETCIAAGMDDFLSKPFRRDDLTRVLAMWYGAVRPMGRLHAEGATSVPH